MRLKAVEEEVVVLMGASSGIGRETALRFAKSDAKMVVSARGKEGSTPWWARSRVWEAPP